MKKKRNYLRHISAWSLAALLAVSVPAAALADTVLTDSAADSVLMTDFADDVTTSEPAYADGAYQITTAEELYWFAEAVNSGSTSINAVLCNDITLNEDVVSDSGNRDNGGDYTDWTPAGTTDAPYTGTFDGNDYTISGLYYKLTTSYYVGFFGALGSGAVVSDLHLADAYLYGARYVGGIAAYASGASIEGCTFDGSVNGDIRIGGICAYAEESAAITECINNSRIYCSGDYSAGICSDNNTGSAISYCINNGTIVADRSYAAGICGTNDSKSSIISCYNVGTVSSESGTYSAVCDSNTGKVKTCYYVNASSGGSSLTDSYATPATADEAAGGFLCYKLNNESSSGSDVHFYQTIGEDDYPVLDSTHGIVYRVSTGVYSNTAPSSTSSSSSSSSSDSDSSAASSAAQNGTVIKKGKITYVVSSQSAQTVMVKTVKKAAKKITIPSTISYNGVTYSVTKISANACKNCKKLKKVTIGANVTVIGKKAFYNCKKLKTVIFMGRRVQTIKKKAFKGTAKKITVKVTSSKMLTYQKLLKKAGISSKAKYKKT